MTSEKRAEEQASVKTKQKKDEKKSTNSRNKLELIAITFVCIFFMYDSKTIIIL